MRRHRVRLSVLVVSSFALMAVSPALAMPVAQPRVVAMPDLFLGDGSDTNPTALPPADTPAAQTAAPHVTIAGVDLSKSDEDGGMPRILATARRIYCVEFARVLSGITIRGNASTWWEKAKGLYARLTTPEAGSVMVFAAKHGMRAGHVAVVKTIVSNREVLVDHANWGRDGKIYVNAPVIDVSPKNDWSEVRVWNAKLGVMGAHTYRIRGFVGI